MNFGGCKEMTIIRKNETIRLSKDDLIRLIGGNK